MRGRASPAGIGGDQLASLRNLLGLVAEKGRGQLEATAWKLPLLHVPTCLFDLPDVMVIDKLKM